MSSDDNQTSVTYLKTEIFDYKIITPNFFNRDHGEPCGCLARDDKQRGCNICALSII